MSPRSRRRNAPAFCLSVALLSLAVGLAARAEDTPKDTTPYTWTFKYKKGDASKYRQNLRVSGMLGCNGFEGEVKAVSKVEVKETTDKGEATLVQTLESQDRVLNGIPLPDDPETHFIITRTVTPTGLLLKHEVEKIPAGLERLVTLSLMQSIMPTPEKAVQIGDSWKTEVDNLLLPGKKVTMTSTLDSKGKVAGVETLKVKFAVAIPTEEKAEEKQTVQVEGAYEVDPKEGRLMRALYSVDNMELTLLGQVVRAKANGKLTLIVPGVNDKDEKEEPEKDKPAK